MSQRSQATKIVRGHQLLRVVKLGVRSENPPTRACEGSAGVDDLPTACDRQLPL